MKPSAPKRLGLLAALALATLPTLAQAASTTVKLPGLKAPVEVAMDSHGVWHIEGKSDLDVVKVQGYLVAKYRLFQMDVFRRRALGTRAELMGKEFLKDDFNAKMLLVEKVTPKIMAMMDPKAKALLKAYADGANVFIQSPAAAALPEYKALKVKPMPWRPEDTIAIGRAMSWSLSGGFPDELIIGVMKQLLGQKKFDDIRPERGIDPITITKLEAQSPSMAGLEKDVFDLASSDIFSDKFRWGNWVGSNNWVVSGKRTKSGMPLLANDPHLGLDVPPIWVMVHLTAPGLNVAGVSFAGTPGVVIGHNDHLAWGVTTTGYDVTDAYIMVMNPRDNTQYKFGNEYRKVTEETLTMKYNENGVIKSEQKKLRMTHFGPIALERDSGLSFGKTIAFRWTGHDPSAEIETFMQANFATNLEEFKKALSHFQVGAQNFVYMDLKGNIFYYPHADVPLHSPGTVAYLPLDGSKPEHQWQGYIPYDKLPQALNPAKGYIATANNRPAPADYPYYIGEFWDGGSRAKRISDMIEATPKHDVRSFQAIQMDTHVVMKDKFLPRFLQALSTATLDPTQKRALDQLKMWNGATAVDSLGPVVFFKLLQEINLAAFSDDIKPDMAKRTGEYVEIIGDLLRRELAGTLKLPWFDIKDTPQVETLDDIVRIAFPKAVEDCARLLGPDPAKWTWGRIHQITLNHDFLKAFNRGPIPGPGAYGTVNNAGFDLSGDRFDYGGGPSIRLVMEAGKTNIKMWATLPGADIADWKSKDAVDQLGNWFHGRYFEFVSVPGRAKNDKDNKRRLTFKP